MKLVQIIFVALVAISCTKQDVKKKSLIFNDVEINILLAYNDSTVYERSDSAYVEIFKDGASVQKAYTIDGKVRLIPVEQDANYYFTFVTRTYTNGYEYYHFKGQWDLNLKSYGVDTNIDRSYFKNYYVCVGGGIGKEKGIGTTPNPVNDNFGIIKPFKAW